MNAEANLVPDVEITGFPSIKFYPAADKTNPISFTGSRDVRQAQIHIVVP
jgi:hypothetical protein